MEANPGTVECGDPAGYRAAGVNRLSIGAQSFDAAALGALGRIHSVADIGRAFRAARSAGFTNLNLDLMYGLPGQTVAAAMADIDAAMALEPDHVSWYQLTIEPNTVFHAHPPAGLPDEDTIFEIEQAGRDRLTGRGYARYEVSAYAQPGHRSVHNLNYWSFGDYLAVGAGAHGKLSQGADILRYAKPANPLRYMDALETGEPAVEFVPVTADERVFEFMLNALRLVEGFTEAQFTERTGLPAGLLRQRLSRAVDRGLIGRTTSGGWRATEAGGRFLNDLQAEFLPA
jgi:oxygen-independent coproporphyrinogen-3 oxidase